MARFNLQAILFAAVLSALVFISRQQATTSQNNLVNNGIAFTSVRVNLKNVVQEPLAVKPDNVNARAILVKKLGSSQSILKVSADRRWPIASLTKLMTAVVALEKFSLEQKIYFDDKIIATEGISGDFRSGESFTVADLIKALMLVSSNDAATALAEAYGSTSSPQGGSISSPP